MKRKALLSLFVLIAVFSLLTFPPETKAAEYPEPGKVIDFTLYMQHQVPVWTHFSAWSPVF